MAIKNGEWIMRGMEWDDPARIQSWEELIRWIHEIGFLPLFKNEIDGFSVEENTVDLAWWTGDPNQDPWEWRALIASTAGGRMNGPPCARSGSWIAFGSCIFRAKKSICTVK